MYSLMFIVCYNINLTVPPTKPAKIISKIVSGTSKHFVSYYFSLKISYYSDTDYGLFHTHFRVLCSLKILLWLWDVEHQYKHCSFSWICVEVLSWIASHVHLHPYPFLLVLHERNIFLSTYPLEIFNTWIHISIVYMNHVDGGKIRILFLKI